MAVLPACSSCSQSVAEVRLSASGITIAAGESYTLVATVLPEDADNKEVRWESDNISVALVSGGVVTGVSEGEATITVTTTDGGHRAKCAVTVTAAAPAPSPVPVESVAITPATLTLAVGVKGNLTATVSPENATDKTVAWKSENTEVATVDQDGQVTAVAAGTAIIVAQAGDKSANCTVTVTAAPSGAVAVSGVEVTPATLSLKVGVKGNLTATVSPVNATDKSVAWKSENTSVATVDQNGQVTAIAAGTARITAEAGGKSGYCTVTVAAEAEVFYDVKFYSDGDLIDEAVQHVKAGEKAVEPKGVTKENYTLLGWKENLSDGSYFDFNTPVTGNLNLYAVWQEITKPLPEGNSPITYTYAGNECAAFEWKETDLASRTIKVGYKLSSASSYTYLAGSDRALIRAAAESGKARVDIVGLKGGEKYDFAITASDGKTYTVSGMQISSYDRSGYAHFKYSGGVGAYNDDGTLKSNATVIYVTEATKNSLTVTIGKKSYSGKSIVEILGGAKDYTSTPVVVRIIGTVGAATWTHIEEGAGARNAITPEQVKGKLQGTNVLTAFGINKSKSVNITQAELIEKGVNTLDTSKYAELKGLDSKMKYDSGKDEFDSAWNNCIVQNAKNITLEGIGEDARIFQWGITWKNCNSIEVRNLTFEDYTEDACSFEGGETSAANLEAFKSGNYWIHHNTFEEGVNYWDVCNEQDKHDGDGSTDFKGVKNVTLSYNVYNSTHKTGLIGGSDSHTTANVTFHHNYYNGCVSRLPLARQANMHMYNNYYKGTTSTDISLRANAYAFVENCYFENSNKAVELVKGSSGTGSAKIVGCVIDNKKIYVENGKTLGSGATSDRIYVGDNRNATVVNDNKFGKNFDTNGNLFYLSNGKSDVTEMLTAAQTKEQIPLVAGVMKRSPGAGGGTIGGDSWEAPGTGGSETDPGTQGGQGQTTPETPGQGGSETDPGTQGGQGQTTPETPGQGGSETDPGTQGGGTSQGGAEAKVDNCVIIISNGVKLLKDGALTELPADSGISVTTGDSQTFKNADFYCDGEKYEKGYKIDSKAEITIKLAAKKQVTLYYYAYGSNAETDPGIKINGVAQKGGNGKKDQAGVCYSVTVTLEANAECVITRSSGEATLCYMVISDAA